MKTTIKPINEKEEAVEWFKKYCPKGSTVFTVLRHVSASGMTRDIGLIVFAGKHADGEPITFHPNYLAAKLTGWRMSKGLIDGVRVSGCGMDMGFHLVYTLAQVVYGDGYALKQRWL